MLWLLPSLRSLMASVAWLLLAGDLGSGADAGRGLRARAGSERVPSSEAAGLTPADEVIVAAALPGEQPCGRSSDLTGACRRSRLRLLARAGFLPPFLAAPLSLARRPPLPAASRALHIIAGGAGAWLWKPAGTWAGDGCLGRD